MKQKKTLFFGFQACDVHAAQEWLEEQYAKGWELVKLKIGFMGLSLAQFRPRSEEFKYCVDVATSSYRSFDARDEYLNLCADAGWTLIDSNGGLFVFRSAPGADPAPIHTDFPLEGRRFWKEALFPNLITGVVCVAIFILVFFAVFLDTPLYRFFLLDRLWIWCALLLLSLAFALCFWVVSGIHNLRLWRALADGSPPPKVNVRRLRRRSAAMSAISALILSSGIVFQLLSLGDNLNSPYLSPYLDEAPILTWEELGQAGQDPLGRAMDSYFIRSVSSHQAVKSPEVPTPVLYIDYYACRYDWTADLVRSGLLRGADFTAADLGFDEAYTAREGDTYYLILRHGTVAAYLKGPVDFTAPDVLSLLREEVSS